MNTVYHSQDFTSAFKQSNVDLELYISKDQLADKSCIRMEKLSEVHDASGDVLYRYNSKFTEFRIGDTSVRKFDDALLSIASTKQCFNGTTRYIRVLLRDRITPPFSKVISYMIDDHSEYNVFLIVTSSLNNLDGCIRSRFINKNCNNREKLVPIRRFSNAHCDAFVKSLRDDVKLLGIRNRPDKLFEYVHKISYKLCGTMVPFEVFCKSCINVLADPSEASIEFSHKIVAECARMDAIRRGVNKPSLLFDSVLFTALGPDGDFIDPRGSAAAPRT